MTQTERDQYRQKLLSLRNQVRQDIQSSIEAIVEEVHVPGEDNKEPSEGLDKELALEQNEEEIYQSINAALQRLDEGTFGTCIDCGSDISAERLEALPWTSYCVRCERKIEQQP